MDDNGIELDPPMHSCDTCTRSDSMFAGDLPEGWVFEDGLYICPACVKGDDNATR